MILAIESATPRGSVALVAGDAVVGEVPLPSGRQASATIVSAVARLLAEAPGSPGRPAHVAVSSGPGSFTGLRVGMAAAKGFCVGWGIPLVPVPTLHALALGYPAAGAGTLVCTVLDARKKEVYAALFRWEGGECRRVLPDMAVAPRDLPDRLPPGRVLFLGDGGRTFGALFRERMGSLALFPPGEEGFPSASSVGLLAARLVREGAAVDPRLASPSYLRPSEAEIGKRPPPEGPGGRIDN